MNNEKNHLLDTKTGLLWLVGSAAYFAWFGGVVGLRAEHTALWIVNTIALFYSEKSRSWVKLSAVWSIYWIIYDSLRVVPNYTVNAVHIRDLYDFDKKWFGISGQTLNEWCAAHVFWPFDLAAGLFYISWVPLPLMFAAWLFWKDKALFLRFSWCWLLVNLTGFVIYYLFPAAPPWYVDLHGFEFKTNVMRSAAGLDRVDDFLGVDLFNKIYTRNSNVFAAMPSLHSAYPLVGWLYARHTGRQYWIWLFGIFAIGIWVSAIYTNHHYVLDVLAGIGVAAGGYFVFEKWLWPRFLSKIFQPS